MWRTDEAPGRVKQVRQLYAMTQEEFADLLGVSVATIREWEQGRGPVPLLAQKFITRLKKDREMEPVSAGS